MPDEYFPTAGAEDAMPSEETPEPGADTPPEETEGGTTALLPKSVLGGKDFEPGEEVVLKVVKVHEDEVEVEYAPEKPDETKSSTDSEIEAMDTKGY